MSKITPNNLLIIITVTLGTLSILSVMMTGAQEPDTSDLPTPVLPIIIREAKFPNS